jgi:hypothetical protein
MALIAVVVFVIGGCTGKPVSHPSPSPRSSEFPSPVEGRIGLTCEHLSHHKVLRQFIGPEDDDFPQDANVENDSNFCITGGRVEEPVNGVLTFSLDARVTDAPRQEFSSPSEVPPNLKPCPTHAQCWIGGPTDCHPTEKPSNVDFRNFVAAGRIAPYEVRVEIGIWPDNYKRDLCRADRWSKAMAAELLYAAVKYLKTGS